MKVLKFTIETQGYDLEATDFRPLPGGWDEMTSRDQDIYLARMELHLSTRDQTWANFIGVVDAPPAQLTAGETADLLGVSRSTLRRWVRQGRVAAPVDGLFCRDLLFRHIADDAERGQG